MPLYQRPYAWTKEQWEDLLEDLKNLKNEDIHFLGTIVVVPENRGPTPVKVNYFEVVDGQQRLATILIWLAAIRDLAREKGDTELVNHLNDTFLFAKDWKEGRSVKIPKLQLGQLDNDAFQRVLEGKPQNYNHLIFECYSYFKNYTDDENIWQVLLNNVCIVCINAFNYFNAFRLFETLNDRGLELSAADLIKNFILEKASLKKEIFDEIIEEWHEMYEKIRDKEPVKFIRRYFLSNYKGKISESRLYEEVRKRLEKELEKKKIEMLYDFVKDLNTYATIYKKIFECSFSQDKINKKLQELHLVEVSPSFTLFFKVMLALEKGEICEEDVLEIMKMVETFHIRWGICGQSTSRLDQIYNDICIELKKKKPKEFKLIIKDRLLKEIKDNVDDEIFKRNFTQKIFQSNDTRTKYILWKLSNPTGETTLNIEQIQTEHILPRTLSKKWINYLKNNTSKSESEIKILHKENFNRIGNLTIIKGEWNLKMSNRLFDEKKKDYEKSEFQITKELCNYKKWTFEEIEERSKQLAEKACNIWKIK